jgi:hypothetical protein
MNMESMKTDAPKNKPPQKAPHPLAAELATMDGIPVFELRFCVQGGRDLPLPDSNGGFGVLRATDMREITYLTKPQLFRVVQRTRDPMQKTRTLYVPREWAMFEPLE